MFAATIFDFNGVLVDDELVHLAAFREAVAPLHLHISEQEYWDELLGFDDAGAFAHLLQKAGLPAPRSEIDRLIEVKKPLYMDRATSHLETFPGAARLVAAQAEQGPVLVVSGALRDEIILGLERLGVDQLVAKIISAEDTTASKPDPEGYLQAMSWLRDNTKLDATRALVIEDSLDGIRSAKAAGLCTVAVAHSYQPGELKESGADACFAKIEDISPADLQRLYNQTFA